MKKPLQLKTKLEYFQAEKGSWFFVALEKELSQKISKTWKEQKGWGRIKVEVTIGKTTWQSNLFSEKKERYLLVIKKPVAEAENLKAGDLISLTIQPL